MLLVAVIIAALDTVGVKTTAVVAVLGAAGLAIGLALQGSLSNFAAGVMLIVLRPYKVGDLVTIGKYLGRVDAIRVFQTILDHRRPPRGHDPERPDHRAADREPDRARPPPRRSRRHVAQATDLGHVRSLLEGVVHADERIEQRAAAHDRDRRDHRREREALPPAVDV